MGSFFAKGENDSDLVEQAVESTCLSFDVKVATSSLELRLSAETRKNIESCSKFEAEKKVVFEFELLDNFGDKVTQNNIKDVKIHGRLKPPGYEAVNVNRKDKNSNFYLIEFVPVLRGKRELNLKIGEKPVKDCPICFEVVQTSQPSPEVSQIETENANSKPVVEKVEEECKESIMYFLNRFFDDEPAFEGEDITLVLPLASIGDHFLDAQNEQSQTESVLHNMQIQIDDQEAKIENFEISGDTLSLMLNSGTHSGKKLIKVAYRRELIDTILLNVVGIKELEKERFKSVKLPNNNGNTKHFGIKCEGFKKRHVKGPDNSHIDKINRVFSIIEGEKILNSTDISETNESIEISFSGLSSTEIETAKEIRKLILTILRGQHFRSQAWQFDEKRSKWQKRAETAYDNEEHEKASFSREIKEKYQALMCQAHEKACELIFYFHNYKRNQSEIDLHGLLVANEKSVEDYRQQLQQDRRYRDDEALIDKLIKKKRDSDNEAIKKLQERLDEFDLEKAREQHSTWLEIIVGAGHHSKGNRQKIKPAVEEFLKTKKQDYRVADKGNFLYSTVTLGPPLVFYSSPTPLISLIILPCLNFQFCSYF